MDTLGRVITKADLGLENALTELPYATEETDGIITAEMFQRLSNGEGGVYSSNRYHRRTGRNKGWPTVRNCKDGTLSAVKQTDQNFTTELKSKLEELKNYTAGRISLFQKMVLFQQLVVAMAAVNQQYVDQKVKKSLTEYLILRLRIRRST